MFVSFCLPKEHLPDQSWIEAWERGHLLPLEESGKGATAQCWIYQTWALLIKAHVPCSLLEGIPRSGGIIIAMSGSFPSIATHLSQTTKKKSLFYPASLIPPHYFLVDIVADGLPHPAAHLHLVQNKAHAKRLPRSLFMPHWTQPHLLPRDAARGARFETIAFFGDSKNLAPELYASSWQERLHRELGIKLELRNATRWHDYHDVDGVIAIRDFSKSQHHHKPATKLYNAWHAGVPFIGGHDSAYVADGHPNQDYLIATSPEEVFQYLKKLKEDPALRLKLVQNGFQSEKAYTRHSTLNRWKHLLQITLPHYAREWQQTSLLQRFSFSLSQRFFCFLDRTLR